MLTLVVCVLYKILNKLFNWIVSWYEKKSIKFNFSRTENDELYDLIVLHKLDNNMQLSKKFHEDFGIFHSLNGLKMPNRLYVSLLCNRIENSL